MPDSLAVRVVTVTVDPGAGFRTTEIQIACTMLDPRKMSASKIGDVYQNRWKVELFIDDLKTTLGMAVLKNAQSGDDPARTPYPHHRLQSLARPDEPRQVGRSGIGKFQGHHRQT
jgi:hypothetical protein